MAKSNNSNLLLANLVYNNLITYIMNYINGINIYQSLNELQALLQNPLRLGFLLKYYGFSEKILSLPAHRLNLENIAKIILKTIMNYDFKISDYEFKRKQFIKLKLGSPLACLLIIELNHDCNTYKFSKYMPSSSGQLQKTIEMAGYGVLIDITDYSENITKNTYPHSNSDSNIYISKRTLINLDVNGFAISYAFKDFQNNHIKTVFREKDQIQLNNGDIFEWNGNPLYLNSEKCTKNEINQNTNLTLLRNPEAIQFYEDIFGKERIQKVFEEFENPFL